MIKPRFTLCTSQIFYLCYKSISHSQYIVSLKFRLLQICTLNVALKGLLNNVAHQIELHNPCIFVLLYYMISLWHQFQNIQFNIYIKKKYENYYVFEALTLLICIVQTSICIFYLFWSKNNIKVSTIIIVCADFPRDGKNDWT